MSKKIIVEGKSLDLDLGPEGFTCVSGDVLKAITVSYETYGELNEDGSNAIYICHALTGDAHVAHYHQKDDKNPGWWDPLIGPGRAVDTNKYFVVCSNILGGCKGTTGPSSIDPETKKPYGLNFPLITVKAAVRVQHKLLVQLGLDKLYAVIGGSLGGMQALEWAISFPDFVERCVCIAAGVNLSPQALAFDVIGRQEIEHDPHWLEGDYYDKQEKPVRGLSRARMIGHVTYQSAAGMEMQFGREEREFNPDNGSSKFSTDFQVESYLNYNGDKFTKRFDANSYLYISRMLDTFDLVKEHGGINEAFKAAKSKFLIVSISSDWLFPPSQQRDIVHSLIQQRKQVSFLEIDSPDGHDAFLTECKILGFGLSAFLNGKATETELVHESEEDLELLKNMIEKGQHLLDVGSGDGRLLQTLVKEHQVTGICLDQKFDMVVECMKKGLSAVQMDADEALLQYADNCFDLILLNQTIQQLHSALQAMKQMLRIAPSGIINFPNFAYIGYRAKLLFEGRLPVSKTLPYEWYDTPNIHLLTVKDFKDLCHKHDLNIVEINHLPDSSRGRLIIGIGMTNWGAERSLVKIDRSKYQ